MTVRSEIQQKLNRIEPGAFIFVLRTDGDVDQGRVQDVDAEHSCLRMHEDLENLDKTLQFDEIEDLLLSDELQQAQGEPYSIEKHLRETPIGTYLMITGRYGNAINPTIEQGKLKSIDWDNRTVVLRNTVYDRDVTVRMDQMISIDDTRTGSGALTFAQEPDWYCGADGKWRKAGREYKPH